MTKLFFSYALLYHINIILSGILVRRFKASNPFPYPWKPIRGMCCARQNANTLSSLAPFFISFLLLPFPVMQDLYTYCKILQESKSQNQNVMRVIKFFRVSLSIKARTIFFVIP